MQLVENRNKGRNLNRGLGLYSNVGCFSVKNSLNDVYLPRGYLEFIKRILFKANSV